MRKISIFILTLFVCFLYIISISFATDKHNLDSSKLMIDKANLLSDSKEQEILSKLEYIKNYHQCEVVILTVNSLDNLDVLDYADLYYSNNNYGYGDDKTGIMLIISDEERDYGIYVRGKAIDIAKTPTMVVCSRDSAIWKRAFAPASASLGRISFNSSK